VQFDRRQAKIWDLKAALRSLGLFEVVTYSFVSAEQIEGAGYDLRDHLKLKNPLSSEQAYLRSSLLPSLLSVVSRNSRYSSDFGLFEVSRVFDAPKDRSQLPDEPVHVAVMRRAGFKSVREALDLLARQLHLKFKVEADEVVGLHPKRAASVSLHGDVIGVIGELHPQVAKRHKISGALSYLELDLDVLLAAAQDATYRTISKYPSIVRDLAIVVDKDVVWSELARSLQGFEVAYLSEYRGEDLPKDSKSVALRLTFSSMERTLTDGEAEAGVAEALDILKREFKAELRK
jgi:phenylalanyl-tRNA synthetase beta chain